MGIKVLFTGGGTAGHINPALAAAGYLKQREPDAQILYVGNKGGMEERLVANAGYEIRTVTISGFQRKLTPKTWRAMPRLLCACLPPVPRRRKSCGNLPRTCAWAQAGM